MRYTSLTHSLTLIPPFDSRDAIASKNAIELKWILSKTLSYKITKMLEMKQELLSI